MNVSRVWDVDRQVSMVMVARGRDILVLTLDEALDLSDRLRAAYDDDHPREIVESGTMSEGVQR